jgi:regulator of replication initiation timing
MANMTKTATRSVDLEPIDRLEAKLKILVGMVDRMRSEQARAAEENQRLSRELESMRGRLAATETINSELSMLKEERDVIRTRVGDMLDQLEALNL